MMQFPTTRRARRPIGVAAMLRVLPILVPALMMAAGAPVAQAQTRTTPGFGVPHAATLDPEARADLARIETYLNGIGTLQARFRQVAEDGGEASGVFAMQRPGRLRLDYEEPMRDFIVADGYAIYHWDSRMETQSQQSLGSSLADFILRPQIKLSGDVTVTGLERGQGRLAVTMVQTDDPGQGRLTLIFEDGAGGRGPLQLRQWRVLDAQGLTTTVTLFGVQTGVTFERNRFAFIRPEGRTRPGDR